MTETIDVDRPSGGVSSLLDVPKRRPWHIVIPCLMLALVGFGASFLAKKMYRTSTLILLENDKAPESIVGGKPRSQAQDRTRMLTIRQEVLSRARIEKVLKDLNPYPRKMDREPLSNVVETLRNATQVNVKGAEAFAVEIVHSNPEMAMNAANRLATLFIEESVENRERQVEGAADFLETQLADAQKALDDKDREIRLYKERHLGRLPDQTGANLATLDRLQMDRQNIDSQLAGARQREANLAASAGVSMAPNVAPVGEPFELSKAREELAALRTRYTDEHPDVRAILARIQRLESTASTGARTIVSGGAPSASGAQLEQVRAEIRTLESRRASVDGQMGVYSARVESAPRAEEDLKLLTRDLENLRSNYDKLLTKKLDAQMAERMEKRWRGERYRILEPAYLPESYYYPNRTLFTLGGAILGLLLGLGLAYGVDLFDPTVKTQSELEELISHPVLVTFPSIPNTLPRAVGRGAVSSRNRSAEVLEINDWRGRGKASGG